MKKSLLSLALLFSIFQNSKAQYTELGCQFAAEGASDIGYLSVPNANTIWASAIAASSASQIFARSADGGQTWKTGKIPTPTADWEISSIYGLDESTAWYTLYDDAAGALGAVYKTTDGGETWARQGDPFLYSNATLSYANWTYFWDANEGITMGDPISNYYEIWRTTNGGSTWTRVPSANLPPPISGEYGFTNGYDAKGDTIWFTTNKGTCARSIDRGKTWEGFQTGHTGYFRIYMRDSKNGLSVRTSGTTPSTFRSTSDGGATWSAAFNPNIKDAGLLIDSKFRMRHGHYIPGTKTLVGVGYETTSQIELAAVSYDDGQNFQVIGAAPGDFSQVRMVSETLGYLGGLTATGATDVYRFGGNLTSSREPLAENAPARILTNPSLDGCIKLELLENFDGFAALFDPSGREIKRFVIRKGVSGQVEDLRFENVSPGVFALKLQSAKGVFALKVLAGH